MPVVAKRNTGADLIAERAHQLESEPSVDRCIKSLRQTDTIVADFDEERSHRLFLANDLDVDWEARRMSVLDGVCDQLGSDEANGESLFLNHHLRAVAEKMNFYALTIAKRP